MIYQKFYSELGKLLYAIADVDGVITPQEKKTLQNIVKKELVPDEQHVDAFGTDAAYYTEIEFDFLDEQIVDSEAAFESFINFIELHHTSFDVNLKKVCLHIAKEIAKAYHGTNKKEKIMIEELKQKLEQMNLKNEKK